MQNLEALREKLRTEFIRQRTERGWTQSELSRRAKLAGLPFHQSTIGKIETGKRALDAAEAVALANVLGLDLGKVVSEAADIEAQLDTAVAKYYDRESNVQFAMARYVEAHADLHTICGRAVEGGLRTEDSNALKVAMNTAVLGDLAAQRITELGKEVWEVDLGEGVPMFGLTTENRIGDDDPR
jgi:transcriptional regulator with XRE-family HTH domain